MNGILPTREQLDLMTAAYMPADVALPALRRWMASSADREVDAGSYRFLPQVSLNLAEYAVEEPFLAVLRGLYRREWAAAQLLAGAVKPVLVALQAHSIDFMLLKGAALAALGQERQGLRPMMDVDVLVKPGDYARAAVVLRDMGWSAPAWEGLHAQLFTNGSGQGAIDLHATAFTLTLDAHRVFDPWQNATMGTYASIDVAIPCVSDQLVHTCVHGLEWNSVAPIRWVTDAVQLIATGQVDWDHVLLQTGSLRVSLAMVEALSYIRRHFNADVPDQVLHALRGVRRTTGDYITFYSMTRRRTTLSAALLPWRYAAFYRRWHAARDLRGESGTFRSYLRTRYGTTLPLKSLSQKLAFDIGLANADPFIPSAEKIKAG